MFSIEMLFPFIRYFTFLDNPSVTGELFSIVGFLAGRYYGVPCNCVFHEILFCKPIHPPPLCTSTNPCVFKMLLADSLRIPEAQQVMTGLSFFILLRLWERLSNGIFIEPRTCPP